MDFKLKKTTFVLMTIVFTFIITPHSYAACNAPEGEQCTFSLRAVDENDASRFVTDGGTLKMVGVSRNATITALPDDDATFGEDEPSWSNGSTGASFSHTGGSATYTAKAFDTSKSISIAQKDGSEITLSLKGKAGLKTIAAALNRYAAALGVGVKAKEPTIDGSYTWKYVDLKNSPDVAKHHTVTVDCSAGIEWEEAGIPGLSKTIKFGKGIEIKCGVYIEGDISMSLKGTSTYDPNSTGNGEGSIKAEISGTTTLKLQGKADYKSWWIEAGGGAEVSGNFNMGASASAIIGENGISSSGAKLTYGINLTGKAYAHVNGFEWEQTWTYAPKSLQGEQPFSFNYNFGE